jgi:hypothetical protein
MDEGDFQSYQLQGNSEYKDEVVEWTDLGREGPRSRGKQPRPFAKVLKKNLSDKGFD